MYIVHTLSDAVMTSNVNIRMLDSVIHSTFSTHT